jgi:hypothetical protein
VSFPIPAAETISRLSSFRIAARNEIITVEVGPDRREYKVHKAPLIEHSEFFKMALKKPWKEQQEGVIRLDDIEPEICRLDLRVLKYLSYFGSWYLRPLDIH